MSEEENQMDQTTPVDISSNLLKPGDVAKRLNISRSLAYQLLQRGDIPCVKIGKLVRICESDLQEYILRCRMVERSVFLFDARINVSPTHGSTLPIE
jgi:excisionase family DNA binding protein